MLRSAAILNALVDTRNTVAEIQSTDVHGAVLTLRRTADLAITTASTTITWQAEVRAYQITWATTDITIPEDGWYLISLAWRTSVALNDMYVRLVVNGNFVNAMASVGDVDRATGVATFVRFFVSGDIIQINLIPSANVNLLAIAESTTGESPILNVVQLSGAVDV